MNSAIKLAGVENLMAPAYFIALWFVYLLYLRKKPGHIYIGNVTKLNELVPTTFLWLWKIDLCTESTYLNLSANAPLGFLQFFIYPEIRNGQKKAGLRLVILV